MSIHHAKNGAVDSSLPAVLNERYAESIIGMRAADYDALEIHGVRDMLSHDQTKGTACEIDNDNPQFFSVYVRLAEGGVDCVGDFGTDTLASLYAIELAQQYSWPVHSFVKPLPGTTVKIEMAQFKDGWAILIDQRAVAGGLSFMAARSIIGACRSREAVLEAIAALTGTNQP